MRERKRASAPVPRESMTPNRQVYMAYQDALIAEDRAAALCQVLTPDVVDHSHPADFSGVIALRERMQHLLPDEERSVRVMLEIGDQVVGYVISTATDPTTGKSFSVGILDTVRLDGGKVAERWVALDDPGGKIREVFNRRSSHP